MGYCSAAKKFGKSGRLTCALDETHPSVLDFHFDPVNDIEWRHPLRPMPLDSTRTSKGNRSAIKAASLHTGQIKVIDA